VKEMDNFIYGCTKIFSENSTYYQYLPAIIKLNKGFGYNNEFAACLLLHLEYLRNLTSLTQGVLRFTRYGEK